MAAPLWGVAVARQQHMTDQLRLMHTGSLHKQKVSLDNGSHLSATTHLASTYSERAVQEGQAFEVAAEAYIKAYLDRGAPSLFSTLKPLYRQAAALETPVTLHRTTMLAACTACWTIIGGLPSVPAQGVRVSCLEVPSTNLPDTASATALPCLIRACLMCLLEDCQHTLL